MNNGIWPKRLLALDISRGIAALAVVLWHWQHFAYNGSLLSEKFDRASQPLYAIFKIFYEKGAIGVQYFFLLSGFIFFWLYKSSIENRNTTFSSFWAHRISRLYPLHIVTLLIVALLQVLYVSKTGSPFVYPFNDAYHFLLNLAFASKWGLEKGLSFNAPVWSVSIEILLYFLFFIAAYARQGRALFCLSVSAIALMLTLLKYHEIFLGASLFFLGGFVFHATFLVSTRLRKLRLPIHIVTALAWILTLANFYVFDLSRFILEFNAFGKLALIGFPNYILFPFTVCSLSLIEIDKGAGFLKPISWVGDITYSSYLLHFPLQLAFGLVAGYGFLNSDFYLHPVYLVIFFSILIPLSYITFIGFERPMQNMIRDKYRRHMKG
jgi:peptidoglycan/LPS O-acetylase OafA/YrhL